MEAMLVSLLAPFLKQLLEGQLQAAEDLAGKAGDAAFKHAASIWSKLWPRLKERPVAAEAARDVGETPEDEDAQGALRLQLRKLLEQEPGLKSEIEGLLESARRDGVMAGRDVNVVHGGVNATERSIAVGRDVGGNVSTSGQ